VPPPDVVKLDVDGNEHAVLLGMRSILTGVDRPRALKVELNPTAVKRSACWRSTGTGWPTNSAVWAQRP
jgi:hypothetical protein